MADGEVVSITLNHGGSRHEFKFFRGTSHAEVLSFVRELLGLPATSRLLLLDQQGTPVLLNSHVPSSLELAVAVASEDVGRQASAAPLGTGSSSGRQEFSSGQRGKRSLSPCASAEQYCLEVAKAESRPMPSCEAESLQVLASVERLSRAASLARRRLLDSLGPAQVRRLVFRPDTPVHARQLIFGFCAAAQVVRCAEVSRGFHAWASCKGRRILPRIDDRVLCGGPEKARHLAAHVHPSFLCDIIAEREGISACAFLEAVTQEKGIALSSLRAVSVANTQYAPASLLIRLLQKAGGLRHVKLLTRLDRPLPPQCLRKVRCLEPLVLHATELHGFPSLFAGGSASTLRRVVLRDTGHLDFDRLLSALPASCPPGEHSMSLEVVPHGCIPSGRMWDRWLSPLPEMLKHPALAAVWKVVVPAPTQSGKLAVDCFAAVFRGLKEHGAPPSLQLLEFQPYKSESGMPSSSERSRDWELEDRISSLLESWEAAWPWLLVEFPGITS